MQNSKKQPKLSRTAAARLRVKDLRRLLPGGELDVSSHDVGYDGTPEGVCLMEAVAWVAGEEHSDHPSCACPVLTDIGIDINDSTDNAGRQRLIPAIPALIRSKTGSKRTYFKRAKFAAERALQETLRQMDFKALRAATDDTVRLLVLDMLESVAGRPLTKALTKKAADGLRHLDSNDDYGNQDKVVSLLENLHRVWDTDGIDYQQYSNVLGAASFSTIIPDRELPDFFVELATTHA